MEPKINITSKNTCSFELNKVKGLAGWDPFKKRGAVEPRDPEMNKEYPRLSC